MAVIGKIRSYSWLLLAFIGLALLAFILGDFRPGQSGPKTDLGEVAGEQINVREFDKLYQEQLYLYKQQRNVASLDQQAQSQLLQEVWDQVVRKTILHKEGAELGLLVKPRKGKDLSISIEEMEGMTYKGPDFHPYVKQFFTQGQPENFDPIVVEQFLKTFEQQDPYVQQLWEYYQDVIEEDRVSQKYFNLISKGLYVTSDEAKKNAEEKYKMAKFRYVALKYSEVPDSAVSVSESDIQEYYEKEKYKYEQGEGRTVEYVMFAVKPSVEDFKNAEEEIYKLKEEFAKDDKPAEFVGYFGDGRFDPVFHKKGALDAAIDTVMFTADDNTVVGPYLIGETYKVARLLKREHRPDSLKASHILIAHAGAFRAAENIQLTPEQAEAKADSLLAIIKNDKSQLAALAALYSDDASVKENQGDLDWFVDGQMVKEFNEACVEGKVGDVFKVQSPFGFHIVHLTGKTEAIEKIQVAVLERTVNPSENTYNKHYNDASTFASEVQDMESFKAITIEKGLNTRFAENFKETDRKLPGMDNPIDMVRWAYSAEVGDVSQVFDVGDKYIVACLKENRVKGFAPLEQIGDEMKAGAIREKKAKVLIEKINLQLNATSDINELAQRLNVKVESADNLSFSAYGIPLLGAEPAVIGTVFGMETGKLSKPVKGKTAAVVVLVDEFVEAPQTTDAERLKMQLMNYLRSRSQNEGFNALKKNANITDNRGKFY